MSLLYLYIQVPKQLPVLILANFLDRGHHRCVTTEQGSGLAEWAARELGADARYAESSMRNGFGLRFLHRFLSLPYLQLRREALLHQLEANGREAAAARQELDLYFQTPESDYDAFAAGASSARRREAERVAPRPTADVVMGQQHKIDVKGAKGAEKQTHKAESQAAAAKLPPSAPTTSTATTTTTATSSKATAAAAASPTTTKVDDFVPDSGGAGDFFWEEGGGGGSGGQSAPPTAPDGDGGGGESDSDSDSSSAGGGNPMVAAVRDTIDDDDAEEVKPEAKADYEAL